MVMTKERKNRIYQAFRDDVHFPGITLHLTRLWSVLERCTRSSGSRPAWVGVLLDKDEESKL